MAYVYRWRGRTRYASLSQYLRKSWPIFAPLNCLMYLGTQRWGRRAVLQADYLENIQVIRNNWRVICDEALALYVSGAFEAIKAPGSVGYYDVGFRTFYKRGWSKFYLKWYGTTHLSARRLCPKTLGLLEQVPGVRGAMFSVLPPGAQLSLHADPMACCLRYHLGLLTPNSELCRITVDEVPCAWFDGQDFIFDETYPHYVRNDTAGPRLILMCDVDRPVNWLGRLVQPMYRLIAKATLVPNTPEDTRGVFSALFCKLAPLRQTSLSVREGRPRTYKLLKWTINVLLLGTLMAVVFAPFYVVQVALF